MKLLPFSFDQLPSGSYFLSNMAGFHTFLKPEYLFELIDFGETSCHEENARLESKFITSSEINYDVAQGVLCSSLAKKTLSELQFSPIFMIVPTLRCDHTCTYCQVSRAPENADGYDLNPESIPKILETIKSLASAPYKIEIQGGEPLLRFDLVKQLYEEAVAQLGKGNFEFVIATSLSLLDENIMQWAKDNKVHFSTSLDGDELVHNKNRILANNSSFHQVKRAVQAIQQELGHGSVATVTTVTKELLERPEALIEAHLELGLHDMFVRPISPYGFANTNASDDYDVANYIQFYEQLLKEVFRLNSAGTQFIEHSASIHMKRILNPGFSQYADLKSPSGFILNSVLFNFDGKVYGSDESRMLQRVLGKIDFSCGTSDSIKLLESSLYKTIISSSFNMLHPGCDTCAYQPFCGADPCQNISLYGEPVGDKSKSHFCQYHKMMFRLLLDLYNSNTQYRDLLGSWAND